MYGCSTAQERLMVVAMGHTDDDYEACGLIGHRDAAHAYGNGRGRGKRRPTVTHHVDATVASDHCFWMELLQASLGARTTSRCGSRRLGIVSKGLNALTSVSSQFCVPAVQRSCSVRLKQEPYYVV